MGWNSSASEPVCALIGMADEKETETTGCGRKKCWFHTDAVKSAVINFLAWFRSCFLKWEREWTREWQGNETVSNGYQSWER